MINPDKALFSPHYFALLITSPTEELSNDSFDYL